MSQGKLELEEDEQALLLSDSSSEGSSVEDSDTEERSLLSPKLGSRAPAQGRHHHQHQPSSLDPEQQQWHQQQAMGTPRQKLLAHVAYASADQHIQSGDASATFAAAVAEAVGLQPFHFEEGGRTTSVDMGDDAEVGLSMHIQYLCVCGSTALDNNRRRPILMISHQRMFFSQAKRVWNSARYCFVPHVIVVLRYYCCHLASLLIHSWRTAAAAVGAARQPAAWRWR
jgi:hypothetical protein